MNTNTYDIIDERSSKPFVGVLMLAYNHGRFIEQAIKSILMQKTNFKVQIFVAEDYSTDSTRQIILKYQKDYPDSFKVILQKQNVGALANLQSVLSNIEGKYIAVLEGDDYWIDPLKLQKQVDFLENNPDYNMTVGRFMYYFQDSKTFKKSRGFVSLNKVLTLKDYLAYNFSQAATFLFRNNLADFPEVFVHAHAGDQAVMIVATQDKKIKYFPDYFSVYRIHKASISHQFTGNEDKKLAYENGKRFIADINEYTNYKYKDVLSRREKINYMYYKMEMSESKMVKFFYKGFLFLYRWYSVKLVK